MIGRGLVGSGRPSHNGAGNALNVRAGSAVRVEDVMSDKIYDVPADWTKRAFINDAEYKKMYEQSLADPERLLGRAGQAHPLDEAFQQGQEHLVRQDRTSRSNGSRTARPTSPTTASTAILHSRGDQTAIIWEGDDPKDSKHITYRELHDEVCRFANILRNRNVKKGDRVTIYMPMIPEAAYAMLACARIGAIHSVVFGGFSPDSLAGRIEDCKSNVVITADEGLRGGRKVPLKANTDEAIAKVAAAGHAVENVIVVKRTGAPVDMDPVRDVWYHEAAEVVTADCPCEEMNAEDPLFILYTSGSTGKPKGVLHTTAGYLVYTSMTHQYVFDYHDGDIYWCTADVGWVTGHSYIVYGPLANGATTLMFEGVPNYPSMSRFWEVIDKHKVNIFYTAPTAIRALMQAGDGPVTKTSRASLRLLGSVGEPINPEAWEWYHRVVGDGRCPIVDTWWQTETGGILITPLPGATALKPGSATRPFFGIVPQIVDAEGKVLEGAAERQSLHRRFLAGPDAHGLWRSRALHRNLFQHLSRQVFHRRRLPPRRGRLLLDHRPRRRRDQRLRPSPGHRRSRVGAGRASESVGGRRGRLSARHQGPGHLRLCHADGRRAAERGAAQGTGATGCARRSARSPRPTSSSSRRACRRPAPARSCAASCARSPRTSSAISATPRRSADPAVVDDLVNNRQNRSKEQA